MDSVSPRGAADLPSEALRAADGVTLVHAVTAAGVSASTAAPANG